MVSERGMAKERKAILGGFQEGTKDRNGSHEEKRLIQSCPALPFRGFVYSRNEELESGWVAFGNGRLLHRPVSFDSKPHSLFQVIDQNTLQVKSERFLDLLSVPGPCL